MDQALRVVQLKASQLTHAAGVLASAFQCDPLFCFVAPNDDQRRRWLPIFQREVLRRAQPWHHNMAVVDATGQFVGAMAVTPPDHYPPAWWRELRLAATCLLFPTPWCPAWSGVLKLRHYAHTFHEIHYPQPHWYLDVIGIHAAHQRRGVGRLLLEQLIAWSASSGHPIWLETQTAANVGYYESFGFHVTHRRESVPHGPPTWGMLRDGQPLRHTDIYI